VAGEPSGKRVVPGRGQQPSQTSDWTPTTRPDGEPCCFAAPAPLHQQRGCVAACIEIVSADESPTFAAMGAEEAAARVAVAARNAVAEAVEASRER